MIFLKNCFVNTTAEIDLIPITHDLRYAIRDAGIQAGLVTVVAPDAGAGLTIATPLPEILSELKEALRIFPGEGKEATTRRKETVKIGAHVKAAILGKVLSIPVRDARLLIGSREDVLLVDFESNARRREYVVQVMGEAAGGEGKDAGIPLGMMGEE